MSTHCRRCGVNVDSNLHNCPLCGAFVNEENSNSVYEYPQVNEKTKRSLFFKICAFLSVIVLAVNVAINVAVNRTVSWSIHVLFGLALVWIAVGRPAIKRFNVRKYLAWCFVAVIALLFYINAWTDKLSTPWAFTLGAPIVVLTWATVLEILTFAHKGGRGNYQIELTKLFVFSAVCIAISFIWLKKCEWGWLVCTARGFVDVLSLSFFAKEKYFSEMKKRLHV
ncbi:MAG: hypothetical protein K2G37_01685 [Clostridia bacterium]|nr:hypothetical protein [Clostridia bacterium]MDE7328444.1 hypothetical protein [Clostridia bacterium]